MHGAQEVALGAGAPPAGLDRDHAAVGQHEGRDVDGVGVAVLGQARAVDVVHRPAGVGAGDLELDDLGAAVVARGRASPRARPSGRRPAPSGSAAGPAGAGAPSRGGRRHREGPAAPRTRWGRRARSAPSTKAALAHDAGGEAGALLVRAPGLVLGDEMRALGCSAQRASAAGSINATRDAEPRTWDERMPATLLSCVNHPIPAIAYLSFAAALRPACAVDPARRSRSWQRCKLAAARLSSERGRPCSGATASRR